jgi:hypothetical protein
MSLDQVYVLASVDEPISLKSLQDTIEGSIIANFGLTRLFRFDIIHLPNEEKRIIIKASKA